MDELTLEIWHKQLIRSLFHYSTTHLNIEKGFMIKHPNIPEFLYKYRDFRSSHKQALQENVLWTSSADKLNDPYDCAVFFDPSLIQIENRSVEESLALYQQIKEKGAIDEFEREEPLKNPVHIRDYLETTIDNFCSANPSPHNEKLKRILSNFFEQHSNDLVSKMTKFMRSGTGVLSLSETPLQHLMWAHYADSFKGFVIEYNFKILPYENLAKRLCFPVFYTKKPRNVTRYMYRGGNANFNNLFGNYTALIKKQDWSYEREWRIVSMIGPDLATIPFHHLPKPSSIILGSKVNDNDRNWMSDFCKDRKIALKYIEENYKDSSLRIVE